MKHEKYTVLILPDNEASGSSFSINANTLSWLKFGAVFLIAVFVLIGVYYIPRALAYNKLEAENNFLLSERQEVSQILKDAKRIEEINQFIESTLGLHYNLPPENTDSTDLLNGDLPPFESMGLLEDLPTYLPISGFMNRGFIVREGLFSQDHLGIDLSSIEDRVVKAAGKGYVIFSDWTYRYGNMIIIDHGNGYLTVYGHNEQNLVSQRQVVDRAEPIAIMGNTGISGGAHLHFEIWHNGVPLDPATFMPELNKTDVPRLEEELEYGE